MVQMALLTKEIVTDTENKFMVTSGVTKERELGDWNWHIHSTIYKIDN